MLGALVWVVCAAARPADRPGRAGRLASAGRPGLRSGRARSAPDSGPAGFASRSRTTRWRCSPADDLLTGLRGKDVLFVVRRELRPGRGAGLRVRRRGRRGPRRRYEELAAAGFPRAAASSPHPRSAESAGWPTPRCSRGCGSTASSVTTAGRQRRFTLSDAFRQGRLAHGRRRRRRTSRTGRRARPSTTTTSSTTPQRRLPRPGFSYAHMPDQYILSAFQRLELAGRPAAGDGRDRPGVQPHPVGAAADHGRLGRRSATVGLRRHAGAGHNRRPRCGGPAPATVQAYGQSIEYSLNTLISFVADLRRPQPGAGGAR